MFFDDLKKSRRQREPMDPDGNELAIPQFLATTRRYFDLAPTRAASRPVGVAQEADALKSIARSFAVS